jgi:hypothetical protein
MEAMFNCPRLYGAIKQCMIPQDEQAVRKLMRLWRNEVKRYYEREGLREAAAEFEQASAFDEHCWELITLLFF